MKPDEQICAASILNIPPFHPSIRASLPPLLSSGVKDTELRVPQRSPPGCLTGVWGRLGAPLRSPALSFVHECHLCLQKPLEFTNPLSGAWVEGEKRNVRRAEKGENFRFLLSLSIWSPSDMGSKVDDTSFWLLLSLSVFVFLFLQSQCHGCDTSESGNGVSLRLSQDIFCLFSVGSVFFF